MSVAPPGQFASTVKSNVPLCREHHRLVLRLADFPATEPGQFVQLSCAEMDEQRWSDREVQWEQEHPCALAEASFLEPSAYLRRPFSLAGRRDTSHGVELDFIHRVVGVGTQWLSRLKKGDRVDLLGPLGNRFALPRPDELAILVGGGVGIPPMLYLATKLAGRKAVAFCGAVSRDLLPLTIEPASSPSDLKGGQPSLSVAEFTSYGIPSVISTDDGSYGFRGFVTQALECFLDARAGQEDKGTRRQGDEGRRRRDDTAARAVLYTCGPEPMMKRVAEIAAEHGLSCQVAVERAMACAMGTCQSCCIRVRKADRSEPPLAGSDWCWRLTCTDGPIFRGEELLW